MAIVWQCSVEPRIILKFDARIARHDADPGLWRADGPGPVLGKGVKQALAPVLGLWLAHNGANRFASRALAPLLAASRAP